jgi:hypothetical protein
MYTYRESVDLGTSPLAAADAAALVRRLAGEWDGAGYDLVARNCVHFCAALAAGLRCDPVPPWVNRAAAGADAAARAAAAAAAAARGAGGAAARWFRSQLPKAT